MFACWYGGSAVKNQNLKNAANMKNVCATQTAAQQNPNRCLQWEDSFCELPTTVPGVPTCSSPSGIENSYNNIYGPVVDSKNRGHKVE